jgi:hypothetical protein
MPLRFADEGNDDQVGHHTRHADGGYRLDARKARRRAVQLVWSVAPVDITKRRTWLSSTPTRCAWKAIDRASLVWPAPWLLQ